MVEDADGEVEAGAEGGGVIQAAGVERDAVDQELKIKNALSESHDVKSSLPPFLPPGSYAQSNDVEKLSLNGRDHAT